MKHYPDVGVRPQYGDCEENVDGRTEARIQNGRYLEHDGAHVGRCERQTDAGDTKNGG